MNTGSSGMGIQRDEKLQRKGSRWGASSGSGSGSGSGATGTMPATATNASTTTGTVRHAAATASRFDDEEDDAKAAQALLAEAKTHTESKYLTSEDSERVGSDRSKKRPRREKDNVNDNANDYYGPSKSRGDDINNNSNSQSGGNNTQDAHDNDSDKSNSGEPRTKIEKVKPDFGLSGALAADKSGKGGSNLYNGVLLKFQEPPEARTPNTLWRLYVFKGEEQINTLHISKQSAYLWGRNEDIADIPLPHPSCSSQHAVLQYRAVPQKNGQVSCHPYLLDLESTNGSFINSVRIDPARYYQLKKGDVLKFGASTREYVLLAA